MTSTISLRIDGERSPSPDLPLLEEVPECGTWALSTYRSCDIRCRYCITGAQGRSLPRFAADDVVAELRRELHEIEDVRGPIALGLGGLCDAYPNAEAELGVTRLVVEELIAQGRTFGIITKGATLRRDIDLFASYPNVTTTVSLCSVDEHAIEQVDPGAPTARDRLALVAELAANGVPVAVSAAPWIPGLTDAAELITRVQVGVPIRFAPLNVISPVVAASPWGERYDQAEIDAAYLAARAEVGDRPHVYWALPVLRPGGTAHQMRNLDGSRVLSGDTPGLRMRRAAQERASSAST
jgi:hypothetical protein